MARASLALFEATSDTAYLRDAEVFVETLDRYHRDPNGAYLFAAEDTPNLITRTKNANDHATPSGNGTLVDVFARLFYLTGNSDYRDRADNIVPTFAGEVARNFFPLSTLINASEFLDHGQQLVVVGGRNEPTTSALLREIENHSLPDRILSVVDQPEDLPPTNPATGKDRVGGKPALYICEGPVCGLPITEPAALGAAIAGTS